MGFTRFRGLSDGSISEILQSFLEMKRIYTHEPFFEQWEARARANLSKAVAEL